MAKLSLFDGEARNVRVKSSELDFFNFLYYFILFFNFNFIFELKIRV